MKQLFYFFTACSLLTLASCSKGFDANSENTPNSKTVNFSIVANAPGYDEVSTKGLGTVARVFWETTDEVAVFNLTKNTKQTISIKSGSISESKATATFEGNLTNIDKNDKLAIVYPASAVLKDSKIEFDMSSQTITKESNGALRVPFCAYLPDLITYDGSGSISVSSLNFQMASSYMNAVLIDGEKLPNYSISSVKVTNINTTISFTSDLSAGTIALDTPTSSTGTITASCTSTCTSTGKTMVAFAVPATTSQEYRTIIVSNGTNYYRAIYTSSALSANSCYTTGVSDFKPYDPTKITVSSDLSQVEFSTSNLYWDGSAWKFEENPWLYPTSWNADHVGHFYWSKNASEAYAPNVASPSQSTTDNFFCDYNHKLSVNGSDQVWYALTAAQWTYLINSNNGSSQPSYRQGNRFAKARLEGKKGLIIFPDEYSGEIPTEGIAIINGYDSSYPTSDLNLDKWNNMTNAGCIFLPASGQRHYEYGNPKFYFAEQYVDVWSSSPHESTNHYAYYLTVWDTGVQACHNYSRWHARAVRLVKNPTYN